MFSLGRLLSGRKITKSEMNWVIASGILETISGILLVWGLTDWLTQNISEGLFADPLVKIGVGLGILLIIAFFYKVNGGYN